MEGLIVRLAQIGVQKRLLATCATEEEMSCLYRQIIYASIYEMIIWLMIQQIRINLRVFAEYWVEDDLVARSDKRVTKAMRMPFIA